MDELAPFWFLETAISIKIPLKKGGIKTELNHKITFKS